jgi:troponin T
MSDEEYEVEAEENPEEEEEHEVPAEDDFEQTQEESKPRGGAPQEKGMSEAEMAMMAAKKKHEAEEAEKLKEYEEMRAEQREKEDAELAELKEKQSRRKEERAEEARLIAERARAEEERRRQEEEERKQRMEEEKRKRDERRKKVGGGGIPGFSGPASGPNFVITKKEKSEKKGPAGKVGPSKEELDQMKADYMARSCPKQDFGNLGTDALKDKVKELHARISKLEADKYDLEKRHERQDYDLKELNERQRQQARNKALAKGLDPEEAANSPHPPKVQVQSKYDRQVDSRSYGERYKMYNEPPKKREPKVFHGSSRPPSEWGRTCQSEELENVRKNLEPPKYQEAAPVEGAKPPMTPVKAQPLPELDEDEKPPPKKEVVIGSLKEPSERKAAPPPPAPEPEPEPEPEAEEEEEEDAEEEEEEEEEEE